jgi:hypothetical protein
MYCDNQAARYITSNLFFHKQTKHIKVYCHFVRENVQSGQIKTSFVNSQDQLTDILTKALDKGPFEKFLIKLGSIDIYEPNLRGSVEETKRNIERSIS